MATIRKRLGKYQVQVRKDGKATSRTFTNKQDALKWAKEAEVQIEQGTYKTKRERIKLDYLLNKWEKEVLVHLKSWPVERYKVALVSKQLGGLYLDEINSSVLASYRDKRLLTASNQTTKHELSLVKRAMKKAVEWGYIDSVPFVRSPSLKNQARARRLDKNQITLLLNAADEYLHHVLLFLIETAMRRGELAKLKISDINLETRLITLYDTKNGTNRVIPIGNKALYSLNYLIKNAKSDYLLNYKKEWLTLKFKDLCDRVEIKDFRLHDLRHEGVSSLFEKGLNMMEVSVISGHKDLAMLKRYTHINPISLINRI